MFQAEVKAWPKVWEHERIENLRLFMEGAIMAPVGARAGIIFKGLECQVEELEMFPEDHRE